jgi:hypothetical protein
MADDTTSDRPDMKAIVEKATGNTIDKWFYDKSNPDYAKNQAALTRASAALYGNVGANPDVRDWKAINSAADPLAAAEKALAAMYSDPAYLVAATESNLKNGYLPEQSDQTFKQMADRVGSTYNSNWTTGTRFEGKINTAKFMADLGRLGDAAYDSYWVQWGGNPRAKGGVVDTGSTTGSTYTPPTTAGTSTSVPASTSTPATTSGITGGTAGSTTTATLPTGTTGKPTTTTLPVGTTNTGVVGNAGFTSQSDAVKLDPLTGKPVTGLITGANTLTPGTFNVANTSSGNVNNGGLISGVAQQLYTQNAQAGLPTGVTPQTGYLGNSTAGPGMTPYNPYGFKPSPLQQVNNQVSQNWYNPVTGQRWTAPDSNYTAPSADWTKA